MCGSLMSLIRSCRKDKKGWFVFEPESHPDICLGGCSLRYSLNYSELICMSSGSGSITGKWSRCNEMYQCVNR